MMGIDTARPPGPGAGKPAPLPAGEATRRFLTALTDAMRPATTPVGTAAADAAEVSAGRMGVARADAMRRGTAPPDTAAADVAEVSAGRMGVARADAMRRGTAPPDTAAADVAEVSAGRMGVARTGATPMQTVPVADVGGEIGAVKRYADTVRLPLPDDARDMRPDPGLALTGRLMRHLLGIGRIGWTYTAPAPAGRPEAGQAVTLRIHRPVPSGGALYPVEAYLAGGSHGFPSGLHHYDRAHHALQLIRQGDHRTALLEALPFPPAATPPDLVLVFTAVFRRTAAKYGELAYPLQCQETGALLAQSLVLAEDLRLSAALHAAFNGPLIDRLLDLPEGAEGTLAVLCLTAPRDRGAARPRAAPRAHELIAQPAAAAIDPPPSAADTPPHLAALHAAATTPPEQDAPWAGALPQNALRQVDPRENGLGEGDLPASGSWSGDLRESDLQESPAREGDLPDGGEREGADSGAWEDDLWEGGAWEGDSEESGLREGRPDDAVPTSARPVSEPGVGHAMSLPEPASARLIAGIAHRCSAPAGFDPGPIVPDAFARILIAAAEGYPGDAPGSAEGPVSCEIHVWALRVDGVPPGSYRYDPGKHRLDPVARWRSPFEVAGRLPPLTRLSLGEAAAVIFPVGDPVEGAARFGDSWYRLQLIETGLVLHRAALAAAALGLAARLHTDVCHHAADAVLGLHGQARRGLGALLVGRPPRRTPTR
jgi:SagB-type dehydrogenase family enzyme